MPGLPTRAVSSALLERPNAAEGQNDEYDIVARHRVPRDNGELFRYVTPTMIATAFERANFMVLKKNRAQLKVDGQAVRGKSGNTEAIHLNIRPLEGSFFGAFYPPLLAVPYRDTMLEVRCVICSHPDLEGFILLDGCHQYFADTMERYGSATVRPVPSQRLVPMPVPPALERQRQRQRQALPRRHDRQASP